MKTVIVINTNLLPGLAANTAAVLGISLGQAAPAILGPDVSDGSGTVHKGITQENIPILAADSYELKNLYYQSRAIREIKVIDFNSIAQKSRDYDDYTQKLAATPKEKLIFSGLCLRGPLKAINSLTGSLKLYR
jgi:hypothetical protein